MPSTSLRPRKQKTIATRRSADSIYSKLGFEYNPAQMDRESFKHGFYAHNMGRPDTPQHVRRLLRGLNRHVETQDKIASAKDVGELLNPDFKAAVKGMTRKQQQRRFKRWEKIPVSSFTARMNALKNIREALNEGKAHIDYADTMIRKMKKFDRHTKTGGFIPAASPSVQRRSSSEIIDLAAVVARRKPAAFVQVPRNKEEGKYMRELIKRGRAQGLIIAKARHQQGVPKHFYFGKRKNVHRAMRIERAGRGQNLGKLRFHRQFGSNLGYAPEKIHKWLLRGRRYFDLDPTRQRRFDVVEASIDHVTPQLRAAADQAQIEVGKPFYRRKKVTPKEGVPITVGRLSRSSREFASGASNVYLGKITLNPTNLLSPAEKKGAATHELLHVTDPGQLKKKELFFKSAPSPRVAKAFLRAGGIAGNIARSLPVPGLSRKLSNLPNTGNPDDDLAKYYSQRKEAHAHVGTMGTLGIEGLKNHIFFNKGQVQQGIKPDRIRQALRKGHLGKLDVISPELSHMRDITKLRHYNPQMQKLYRKSAKEFNLGIERVYGSRNTTGGITNKFGQVKLSRPIGKLPEELQETFDDFNFRINRYGQPDFREVDRGKPGDYTHWNIYKPDKDPVLRPKDPVVRRPARAQMDTPKPSTARDRALAWQRRNRGVAEEVDWDAKLARIKSKLNPKKKESRIDQLRNKLSPVNIVYSSTGQPLSRYRTTPADLAKEVISTEVNHPQRHVWQRIGASQDQRASTVKRPQTVVNFNKQQLYDRVKALDLSFDKSNLKKAYMGKL